MSEGRACPVKGSLPNEAFDLGQRSHHTGPTLLAVQPVLQEALFVRGVGEGAVRPRAQDFVPNRLLSHQGGGGGGRAFLWAALPVLCCPWQHLPRDRSKIPHPIRKHHRVKLHIQIRKHQRFKLHIQSASTRVKLHIQSGSTKGLNYTSNQEAEHS